MNVCLYDAWIPKGLAQFSEIQNTPTRLVHLYFVSPGAAANLRRASPSYSYRHHLRAAVAAAAATASAVAKVHQIAAGF